MMNTEAWEHAFLAWVANNTFNLMVTIMLMVGYLVVTKFALPRIEEKVSQSKFNLSQTQKAYHTVKVLTAIVMLSVVLLVWGIDFSGLLVISTSLLTLTGVALFASWSLLSNITCYFLIMFHASFQRGNFIRILDGDNYLEGFIDEVGLFNTKLLTQDNEVVIYPNNLILNRPSVINPAIKWKGLGKVADAQAPPPVIEATTNESKPS